MTILFWLLFVLACCSTIAWIVSYDFMKEWATKKQLKLCVAEPKETENNE